MDLFDRFITKHAIDFGFDTNPQGIGAGVGGTMPNAAGQVSASAGYSGALGQTAKKPTMSGKALGFLKDTGSWIKNNPGKAGLIGVGGLVVGGLASKAMSN